MIELCYWCGNPIQEGEESKEHIPARNLFVDVPADYKKNRLTVPAHSKCNNQFSVMDDVVRDMLGITNNSITENQELSAKAARSILRKDKSMERLRFDNLGNVRAVVFDESQVKKIHEKDFRGIYYVEYGIPLSKDFKVVVMCEGKENNYDYSDLLFSSSNFLKLNAELKVSGHEKVFRYFIVAVNFDSSSIPIKTKNFREASMVISKMIYRDSHVAYIYAFRERLIKIS